MAADVTIPRLGWSMEEGVFAGWLKQAGDTVRPGDLLFVLEGEKAAQEIEALDGGVLHLAPDAPQPGQTVPVGRLIAKLCASGEQPQWPPAPTPAGAATPPAARSSAAPAAAAPGAAARSERSSTIPPAASPSVRRMARRLGIDLADVAPRFPHAPLSAADFGAAPAVGPPPSGGTLRASPRARRAARDRGIDIATVRTGGAAGRVRERDVLAVADAAGRPPLLAGATLVPHSRSRRAIARQMVRARDETVPVTLTAWADATALEAARRADKALHGDRAATLTDMILVAVATALSAHPLLAARWDEAGLVLPGPRLDIGLAVDAPGGLVVPVVRDVAARTLADVADQTRRLVGAARAGTLTAADMEGGVFTVSSLGSQGIEFFTPVIHCPQAAILGVGAIRPQPVASDDGTAPAWQRQLPLSLSFDHRIVDGAPAARFLGAVAAALADPHDQAPLIR